MQESPQVREWQAKARAEARREVHIEYIRRAICIRFGTPMPADLDEQLNALKQEAALDRWFEAATTAPSLDAFRAAVQKSRRRRKRSR